MHYMKFLEEIEEHATELSVFPNTNNKVCIELQPREYDPMMYQNIALGREDIEMLVKELNRILNDYEIK